MNAYLDNRLRALFNVSTLSFKIYFRIPNMYCCKYTSQSTFLISTLKLLESSDAFTNFTNFVMLPVWNFHSFVAKNSPLLAARSNRLVNFNILKGKTDALYYCTHIKKKWKFPHGETEGRYLHGFATLHPQYKIYDKCGQKVQRGHHDGVNKFVCSKWEVWIPHHVHRWGFYSGFSQEVSKLAPSTKIIYIYMYKMLILFNIIII